MTPLEMVYEFHTYAGHPIEGKTVLPEPKEHTFRKNFMVEEANEADESYYSYSLGKKTVKEAIVDYADALADLQYVLDGWFLVTGLWNKKQEIMEEIHRSNMTKFCKTIEGAEASIDRLVTQDIEKVFEPAIDIVKPHIQASYHYEEIGDYFVVKNTQGKVQKGINYEPPKLKEIIYGSRKEGDKGE